MKKPELTPSERRALDAFYLRTHAVVSSAKTVIDGELAALVRRHPVLAGTARDLATGLAGLVRP
jgi:hypothetical protein